MRNDFESNYLAHHGILGQRWGKRNGPPYPLDSEDHSLAEKKAGYKKSIDKTSETKSKKSTTTKTKTKKKDHSQFYKNYVGYTIKAGKTIQTLSRNPDRLKTGISFYTNYLKADKGIYVGMFGTPAKSKIQAAVTSDIKIPSSKKAQQIFEHVYRSPEGQAKLLALKEDIKNDMRNMSYRNGLWSKPVIGRQTDQVIDRILSGKMDYSDFNIHTLPLDGSDSQTAYIVKLNNMFREAVMKEGYGGVLDVNDTKVSHLRGIRPTILFDKSKVDIANANVSQLTSKEIGRASIPAEIKASTLRYLDSPGAAVLSTAFYGLGVASYVDIAFEEKVKHDAKKARQTGTGSKSYTDMMINDLNTLTDEQFKTLHGKSKEVYKMTSPAYKKRMKASANNS